MCSHLLGFSYARQVFFAPSSLLCSKSKCIELDFSYLVLPLILLGSCEAFSSILSSFESLVVALSCFYFMLLT